MFRRRNRGLRTGRLDDCHRETVPRLNRLLLVLVEFVFLIQKVELWRFDVVEHAVDRCPQQQEEKAKIPSTSPRTSAMNSTSLLPKP
jgi:hypothetical protein